MKYDYVAIVGESESGKSTFARALSNALGWKVAETGHCLDGRLSRLLAASVAVTGISLNAQMWREDMDERKATWRSLKREFGDMLCEVNPGVMVNECMDSGARVVVGMRRPEEVVAMMGRMKISERMLMIILYRKQPIQPLSQFLALPVASEEVCNDGDVAQLERCAVSIASSFHN